METAPVILSLYAMATRFELVLHGDDSSRLRSAGEEALYEIERLDAQLSIYQPTSEMSWINTRAANGPVKVEPRLFHLLQHCAGLSALTDGAFDITIAPLLRAWGFMGDGGRMPDEEELAHARELVGVQHIIFDADDFTISFDRPGVMLDLGAVGKGYAIEKSVDILRESGVTSALLHGGTSTVYGLGARPDGSPWRIGLAGPLTGSVDLRDNCLSVSAVHGKSFTEEGVEFGHVLDPRTGNPVQGAQAAAVIGPSPTICDALSTAVLVVGKQALEEFPEYYGIMGSVKDSPGR